MATACCPAERNQMLPPTTPAKAARIASHGRMLNAPTLPAGSQRKKEIERHRCNNGVDRPQKPKLHHATLITTLVANTYSQNVVFKVMRLTRSRSATTGESEACFPFNPQDFILQTFSTSASGWLQHLVRRWGFIAHLITVSVDRALFGGAANRGSTQCK